MQDGPEEEEETETARIFREAAAALTEKREEEAMSVEERISKCAESFTLAGSVGACSVCTHCLLRHLEHAFMATECGVLPCM